MNAGIGEKTDQALRVPRRIIALLRALQLKNADSSLLNVLSDEEWAFLLQFCDSAQLTLALAYLQQIEAPLWVIARIRKNVDDNALRFERVKTTYKEIKGALERAGIDHVVIKGFTQIPDYVSYPEYRMQSDIDLYCPPESAEQARIALEKIGYESSQGIDYSHADHSPTMIRLQDWKWRGNLFDPEMPLSVELHFTLWNEAVLLFPIQGVEKFWKRRVTRSINDMSFKCFNKVDHLGYLALHILRNLLPGQWVIHHVRELAVFLDAHANDDSFWEQWITTHHSSLRAHQAISFYYARAWFACSLHPLVEDEISRLPPLQRKWLDRFFGSSLESMFDQNKDRVWLYWGLLKTPRAKLTFLRRFLLPHHIASLNSPGVQFENRQPRKTRLRHPYLRYLAYVISRCKAYSYVNLKALFRGLQWRVAYNHLTSKRSCEQAF